MQNTLALSITAQCITCLSKLFFHYFDRKGTVCIGGNFE